MTESKQEQITTLKRDTKETQCSVELNICGSRTTAISTGLGFFDHMLDALAFHAGWDLVLDIKGDLHVDDHHTIEDVAIVLGRAFGQATNDAIARQRFAHAYAPLDEALARAVVDLSGRPFALAALGLKREMIGNVACENLPHFFYSFAINAQLTLHIEVLRGNNDHHRAEAAFKALALALRQAAAVDHVSDQIPSTKGTLSS